MQVDEVRRGKVRIRVSAGDFGSVLDETMRDYSEWPVSYRVHTTPGSSHRIPTDIDSDGRVYAILDGEPCYVRPSEIFDYVQRLPGFKRLTCLIGD